MNEYRSVLERAGSNFAPLDLELESLLRSRDRKRRNQRITAGVVGIAVFVAAIWIVTSVGSLDRSQRSVVPGASGTTGPAEPDSTFTQPGTGGHLEPGESFGSTGTAVDNEFRGWYRVIGSCSYRGPFRDRVQVLYVSEGVRYLAHAGKVWSWRLRYMPGESFPWQTTRYTRRYELRYRRDTDTAVGYRYGINGNMWCVRLIPID